MAKQNQQQVQQESQSTRSGKRRRGQQRQRPRRTHSMPRKQLDEPIKVHVDQLKNVVKPIKQDGSGERDDYLLDAIAACWEKLDNVLPIVATNNREVRKLYNDCWKQFRGVRQELTQQIEAIETLLAENTDDPDELLKKQFYEEGGEVNYLEIGRAVRSQGHREYLEFIDDLDRYLRLVDAANIAGEMDPFERGAIYRHWVKRTNRVNRFVRSFYARADRAHREQRDERRAQRDKKRQDKSEAADTSTAADTPTTADTSTVETPAPDEQHSTAPAQEPAPQDEGTQSASKTEPDEAEADSEGDPGVQDAVGESEPGQHEDGQEQQHDGTRG